MGYIAKGAILFLIIIISFMVFQMFTFLRLNGLFPPTSVGFVDFPYG